jgi:oxygen-independent coproporphyrinogen-3 oxidase
MVDPAELPFEFALNAFRLIEGATTSAFEAATGLPAAVLQPTLEGLAARGLIEHSTGRMKTTALGLRFLNDVQAAFLPATADRSGGSA